jgi:ATP-dependent RNA helicase DHX8/PRP22
VARIVYVIDPGVAWKNVYDLKQGLDSLVIKPISQASAKQRTGHGWCTGPGKCYRFYTESAYRNEMSPTSIPEIQKINLGAIRLQRRPAMEINDILSFKDPPSPLSFFYGKVSSVLLPSQYTGLQLRMFWLYLDE